MKPSCEIRIQLHQLELLFTDTSIVQFTIRRQEKLIGVRFKRIEIVVLKVV